MMRASCLGLAILLLAGSAALSAQTASPVLDVNTQEHGIFGSWFDQLTAVQDRIFFRLTTSGSDGHQLWVTDGTAEGTRGLMDACYGDCSASVELLGGVGNLLFFSVDGFLSEQLWRSDGTPEGTFLLASNLQARLEPGDKDLGWTFFHGALYFAGCVAGSECGLWKSDGTVAGTVRVKDLGQDRSPWHLRAIGDRLFFSASNQAESWLWSSDGTAAGTAELKPLGAGFVQWIVGSGGKVFLSLQDHEAHVHELWASNGTSADTRFLRSFPQTFGTAASAGGRVWFTANDAVYDVEIWTSDGTAPGTQRVTGFGPSSPGIFQLAQAGNRVVYLADDGLHGVQVWSTGATLESTAALPIPCETCGSSTPLEPLGNRILLFTFDEAHGREPWITDGTAAGSRLVADVCPGSCGTGEPHGSPPMLPVASGVLFTAAEGAELWRTDGTAAGTARLAGVPQGSGVMADTGRVPARINAAALGSRVYFGVSGEDAGPSLWVSEGPESSRILTIPSPFGPSSRPGELAALGDRLVFMASDSDSSSRLYVTQGTPGTTQPIGIETSEGFRHDWEVKAAGNLAFHRRKTSRDDGSLWRTDGTAPGTFWLGVFASPGLAEWQGKLFFPYLSDATANLEIWQSDGSKAGTVKALEIPRDSHWQELRNLTGTGPELYFTVDDEFDFVQQVWRSDGTQAGTRKLADFNAFPLPRPQFVRNGSLVLFAGPGGELWRTDGTPGGTTRLLELAPDGRQLLATELTAFEGAVYFFAHTSGAHRALWRSDGTPAGTVPLVEFKVFNEVDVPLSRLTAGGGRLWFAADDGIHGIELWTSDGTAAGTVQVKDILPGADHSFPSELLFASGRLFFTARDGSHGVELWQSDGTLAGTRMVQDIAPFASSSFPIRLTVAGDRLYFSANDGAMGSELWSLPLGGGAPCQPGDFTLCLNGGRFRVEARWRDFQGNAGSARAVSLSGGDTGYFWFFDPANVELILKVLDGQGLNQHHWVFYGALSSVEYVITVTDTQTGLTRQYVNPPGQLASVGDTKGFGPLGAHSTLSPTASPSALRQTGFDTLATCLPSPERLCLRGGRFAVEASWKDFQGNTGKGTAASLTGDTGYFWFFDSANVEVVLKVLDGTALNGKHWVFYGALSNVEYTIKVTDTLTGQTNTYENPSGRFASVADTGAFGAF